MTERRDRARTIEGYKTGELTPFFLAVKRESVLPVVDLLLGGAFEISIKRQSDHEPLDSQGQGAYVITGGIKTEHLDVVLKDVNRLLKRGQE